MTDRGAGPVRIVLLALLVLLVACSLFGPWPNDPYSILRLAALLVLFTAIRWLFLRRLPTPTASGAIVMANGIFLNGAIAAFAPLNAIGRTFAVALFVILLQIFYSILRDLAHRRLRELHFRQPIASFAVGTWIAGISVCSISLAQRLPEWLPFVRVLVAGNLLLWLVYVGVVARNIRAFRDPKTSGAVHGVLFLSTVATQSLVIAAKTAFGPQRWYEATAPWFIGLGVVFYALSFAFVLRRYVAARHPVNLETEWFNTNCIVHGAMSITGLASAVSGVVAPNVVLAMWLWAVAWFILIEIVEIARAVTRVRRLGLKMALFVYDPTQWSRNFTFGMFFAFTRSFDIGNSAAGGTFLSGVRDIILQYFGWVVLALLVMEGIIFLADRFRIDPAVPEVSWQTK